jgi:hypothetical protein
MLEQSQLFRADNEVRVHSRGPDEWIVDAPAWERPLHIYRLSARDWLVSEVGRRNEGRGSDFAAALHALRPGDSGAEWSRLAANAAVCFREHLRNWPSQA